MSFSRIRYVNLAAGMILASTFACRSGLGQTAEPATKEPCCEKCVQQEAAAKPALGQTDTVPDGRGTVAVSLASLEGENAKVIISFQLRDWKAMHFNKPEEAQKHLETVKQLGCVAKQSKHGGHIDVQYHCQEWKSIKLDNAEAAKQWNDWLVSAGFDVFRSRVDTAFSSGAEAVQFRLEEFKALHGDGTPEQNQFIDTLKKVGCDVRVMEHGGHSDIRFRAPTWCTIRVADEAAANQWREWLTTQGFEAELVKGN